MYTVLWSLFHQILVPIQPVVAANDALGIFVLLLLFSGSDGGHAL